MSTEKQQIVDELGHMVASAIDLEVHCFGDMTERTSNVYTKYSCESDEAILAMQHRITSNYEETISDVTKAYVYSQQMCGLLQESITTLVMNNLAILPAELQDVKMSDLDQLVDVFTEHRYLEERLSKIRVFLSLLAIKQGLTRAV